MDTKKPESQYNMFDWWRKAFVENYANFDGRARRAEYWYSTLVNIIIFASFALLMVFSIYILGEENIVFYILLGILFLLVLALAIPGIAVSVRRLHDTNKSGWYYLLSVIPIVSYIGSIVLFVFYVTEGDKGSNSYGPDPKAPLHEEDIDKIGLE